MTQVTLNKIGAGYRSSNALNNDFEIIEEGFERTLDRYGGAGNHMEAPLDMNSNRILNLPAPVDPTDPLRLVDYTDDITGRVDEALSVLQVVKTYENGNDFTDKEQLRYNIQVPTHNGPSFFMEVRVPSQYPTLQAAYNSCEKFFGPLSVFQIRLEDGSHDIATVGTLAINKNISVDLRFLGNVANPAACTLKTDQPGQVLVSATSRGAGVYINGITFEHTDVNNRLNTMGILADDGGFIHMGPAAHTKGFFWNLFARRGGIIRSDGGSHINGGDTNALAYIGGVISVVGCTLTGANDLLSSLGSGAVCEGGAMDISFANLSGNKRAGLHCIEGYVRGMDTQFDNNTNNGVAQDGGHVDLTTGCSASNNGAYGYQHNAGEAGGLSSLTGTGNGAGLIKPLRKLEDGASLDRNYALIRAPADGRWHDNVLAIQNQSVHPDNFRGNAAINFLDSAGTEKGAMGYSRNAGLAPNDGYIADTVYTEFGNPFATANPSHYRLICTMGAGSPWWGGAYTAYDVMHVDPTNGNITFSGNGSGTTRFKDEVIFGQDGVPKIVTHTLASVKARIRERGFLNQYCVATNVQNMSATLSTPVVKDNNAVPSWSLGFGGSDTFVVQRAPAGTGQVMSNVYEVHPNGMMTTSASGNPEGAVVGPVGALFPSSNGTLYFKATGTGNTGWKAVSLV